MNYDASFFDNPVDRRGTACEKWDNIPGAENTQLLPMWVADMDFRCPPAVTEALLARAAHPVYGYTEETPEQTEAMLSFIDRHHRLRLAPENHLVLPCVVTGIHAAIRALTQPGDSVIIQTPVYGPFYRSIEKTQRIVSENPLLRDENGRYTMDFEQLESLCAGGGAKLMVLCSPHNPVGRCWTQEELTRLWSILNRYGIPLISDEIHWDFVYEKNSFTSTLTLPDAQREDAAIVVVTSASKTFNLAGLRQAYLLTRNPELMNAISDELLRSKSVPGNIFSLTATEAAFRDGDDWLEGMMNYLHEAKRILAEELSTRLPKAILTPLEATYLAWIDLRAYGFSTAELMERCTAQGVAFTEGTYFGEAGEGFLRLNFACPHSQLKEALIRLEKAVKAS